MSDGPNDIDNEALGFAAVPCLTEMIDAVVRLVPFARDAAISILDLGSGSGLLAAALLIHFVNARAVLMEESGPLRGAAQARLGQFLGRIEFVSAAFARTELPRGFNVVVSLLGLHGLEEIARRAVYREIYGALNPEGAFLAAEWIRPPTTGIGTLYADIHTREGRVGGASRGLFLTNELPWLATIGFRDVDIHYKNLEYGVFGARRPAAGVYAVPIPDDAPPSERRKRRWWST
jgi:tRNA (cmo5U34)-methyltransferase